MSLLRLAYSFIIILFLITIVLILGNTLINFILIISAVLFLLHILTFNNNIFKKQ
ncbi:hypothetical protein K144313037_22090 [Clostridium tetani]|nr:Uncharacterised protein [Clostridium tetani]SUY67492.1 Uncharacterised protein [Clostridium tetani]BDR70797.1 hypothetical protein K144313037_22090 [Clostridium tetani]BDR76619.1 hypothetical protein K154306013_22790 [Clostridium tetani]BDR79354.1 hypothetical protein K154307017_22870 [Clostridium tetani]